MAVRGLVRAHECAGRLVYPGNWDSLRGPLSFVRAKERGKKTAHRGYVRLQIYDLASRTMRQLALILCSRKGLAPSPMYPTRSAPSQVHRSAAVPARSCNQMPRRDGGRERVRIASVSGRPMAAPTAGLPIGAATEVGSVSFRSNTWSVDWPIARYCSCSIFSIDNIEYRAYTVFRNNDIR